MIEYSLINMKPIPAQRFTTEIGGITYGFTFRQLGRAVYVWLTAGNVSVVSGQMVEHATKIPFYASPHVSGHFTVYDTRGTEHPNYEGLGTRWILVHELNKSEEDDGSDL